MPVIVANASTSCGVRPISGSPGSPTSGTVSPSAIPKASAVRLEIDAS